MKQNHDKLQSELLQMRQFMQKYAPNESLSRDINGNSNEQVTQLQVLGIFNEIFFL